jgi:hypothetical protein
MDYKWEVDGEIHIYQERHVKRYLMAPMTMFPVLLKLGNGELLAVVRGADFHMGERGRLDWVRSRDGGMSWSQTSVIAADGPDNRDPAAIQCSDGSILVFFNKPDGYVNGSWSKEKGAKLKPQAWMTRSEDNGYTWSHAVPLKGLPDGTGNVYGRMIQLPDGTIWLNSEHLVRSRDLGRTWGDATQVAFTYERSFAHLPSGKTIMVVRNCEEGETLFQSESMDKGYTWTEPRKITGYMEHPGDLLLLQSGKLLLTFGRRRPPYGIQAMLSHDEGKSWDTKHRITLVSDAENMEVGYPSSVQLDDGTICTAYYSWQNLFHIKDTFRGYNSWGLHTAVVRYGEEDILP